MCWTLFLALDTTTQREEGEHKQAEVVSEDILEIGMVYENERECDSIDGALVVDLASRSNKLCREIKA